MRNYIVFNGNDSRNYGVYLSGSGTYDAPERAYDAISVAGRDGDILGVEKRLENIEVTYPAFIYTNFKSNLAAFRSMLLSNTGYQTLEDSYHADEFRKAYFRGGIQVEARPQNDAGEFDITFTCKPQRYLLSGITPVSVASGGSIVNPTAFASSPIIEVTGYGNLTIGSDVITIANVYPSVTIDSEMMDCYYNTTNVNEQVIFQSNDFPKLKAGTNNITYDSTITAVSIIPNWWRV